MRLRNGLLAFAALLVLVMTAVDAKGNATSGFTSGRYLIHDNERPLGQEHWALTELPGGGQLLQLRIQLHHSPPQTAAVEADREWRIRRLALAAGSGDDTSFAYYTFTEDSLLGYRVDAGGVNIVCGELTPGYQVDFGSPWFNALMARNLSLAVGESAEYEAVGFELPSFAPYEEHQTLTRLPDETVYLPHLGCERACASYVVDVVGPASAMATCFLLSPDGLVVRFGNDERHPEGWYRLEAWAEETPSTAEPSA